MRAVSPSTTMSDPAMSPQALAEATSAHMLAQDQASRGLGMQLVAVKPGAARMTMTVRADMLNGHKTCHGGFIFTLADSAFAFACNNANKLTVASGAAIDFLAPAMEGDVLSADAVEQARTGKTGVYDITVTNQHGKRIALFRGKSYQLNGSVLGDVPGVASGNLGGGDNASANEEGNAGASPRASPHRDAGNKPEA
ncbi:MAG: phenylacetic acid degradation protein [Herminiimonas sp.]|nr:phenylacetic acid degradation protein [Herminiimonas sp.]